MSPDLPAGARAVVVTASNRASAGVYADTSGRVLADGLRSLGFTVEGPHVRPDDVEALTSVAVAGLTVIDMVKAVDPRACITDVRLLSKSGGKKGDWVR